jgi:hypothetical protein
VVRSENPAGGHFALKPTEVAGHSRDRPSGPQTLRNEPQRVHRANPSGQSACVSDRRDSWRECPYSCMLSVARSGVPWGTHRGVGADAGTGQEQRD